MEVSTMAATAWERGRLDVRAAPSELLFGYMHEDCSIELGAFPPGGRVFSIASGGCTAIALSREHDVLAADINPAQVEYTRRRLAGGPVCFGAAERWMALGRGCAPLAGWTRSRVRDFLDLDNPAEQIAFWRRYLDTRRFRAALGLGLSQPVLRAFYARQFLECLPPHFGRVMRARLERGFTRHSNRNNAYARALLTGEHFPTPGLPDVKRIRIVHADAAGLLESERPGSFDGFTLSNIFDGATLAYRQRLAAAVHRAAAPGALAVIRSFAEPASRLASDRAAEDRSMIWGTVEVKPAAEL
jgi:hypothetical protein